VSNMLSLTISIPAGTSILPIESESRKGKMEITTSISLEKGDLIELDSFIESLTQFFDLVYNPRSIWVVEPHLLPNGIVGKLRWMGWRAVPDV
jgi:hypothetical protein